MYYYGTFYSRLEQYVDERYKNQLKDQGRADVVSL
jgi:hypothetical protein